MLISVRFIRGKQTRSYVFFLHCLEQSSKDTVRQLLVHFINTLFELDILFSKNNPDTGKSNFRLYCFHFE